MKINLSINDGGLHSIVREFEGATEEVQVVRLDDCLPDGPGFLWIDTEGYELEVLKGAQRYIAKWAQGLCVEITPILLETHGIAEIDAILSTSFTRYLTTDGRKWDRISEIKDLKRGHQTDVVCLK